MTYRVLSVSSDEPNRNVLRHCVEIEIDGASDVMSGGGLFYALTSAFND